MTPAAPTQRHTDESLENPQPKEPQGSTWAQLALGASRVLTVTEGDKSFKHGEELI